MIRHIDREFKEARNFFIFLLGAYEVLFNKVFKKVERNFEGIFVLPKVLLFGFGGILGSASVAEFSLYLNNHVGFMP